MATNRFTLVYGTFVNNGEFPKGSPSFRVRFVESDELGRVGFISETASSHVFGYLMDGTSVEHAMLATSANTDAMADEVVALAWQAPYRQRLGTVAGRKLWDLRPWRASDTCSHSLDNIIGYAVRETVRDNVTLWRPATHRVGYDVASFDGAERYADAIAVTGEFKTGTGFAVVDNVYRCGHRSDF